MSNNQQRRPNETKGRAGFTPEPNNSLSTTPAPIPSYRNDVIPDIGRFQDLQGRPVAPMALPTTPRHAAPSRPADLSVADMLNPVQQDVSVASLLNSLQNDQSDAAKGVESPSNIVSSARTGIYWNNGRRIGSRYAFEPLPNSSDAKSEGSPRLSCL
jgi:hypothetical protein